MSARGNTLLQLSKPIEDDLNLRSRRRAGRGLSGRDDAEESLPVERDVVVSHELWPRSTNGLGSDTGLPKVKVGRVVTLIAMNCPPPPPAK
jgi:hypothetical protein